MLFEAVEFFTFSYQFGNMVEQQIWLNWRSHQLCVIVILLRVLLFNLILNQLIIVTDLIILF